MAHNKRMHPPARDNSGRLSAHALTPRHASHIAAILVHEGRARRSYKDVAIWLHFADDA
jgi:hypothetical protein